MKIMPSKSEYMLKMLELEDEGQKNGHSPNCVFISLRKGRYVKSKQKYGMAKTEKES